MSIKKQQTGIQGAAVQKAQLGKIESGIVRETAVPVETPVTKVSQWGGLAAGLLETGAKIATFVDRENQLERKKTLAEQDLEDRRDRREQVQELNERSISQSDDENKDMYANYIDTLEKGMLDKDLTEDELARKGRQYDYIADELNRKYLNYSESVEGSRQESLVSQMTHDYAKGLNLDELSTSLNSNKSNVEAILQDANIDKKHWSSVHIAGLTNLSNEIAGSVNISNERKLQMLKQIENNFNGDAFLGRNNSESGLRASKAFRKNITNVVSTINEVEATDKKTYINQLKVDTLVSPSTFEKEYDDGISKGIYKKESGPKAIADYEESYRKERKREENEADYLSKISANKYDLTIANAKGDKKNEIEQLGFTKLDSLIGNPKGISIVSDESPKLFSDWNANRIKQVNTVEDLQTSIDFYDNNPNSKKYMNEEDIDFIETFKAVGIDEENFDEQLKLFKGKIPSDKELKDQGIVIDTSVVNEFFEENNIDFVERKSYVDRYKKLYLLTNGNEDKVKDILNISQSHKESVGDKWYRIGEDTQTFVDYSKSGMAQEGYTPTDIVEGLDDIKYDLQDGDKISFKTEDGVEKIVISNGNITKNVIQGALLDKLKLTIDDNIVSDKNKNIRSETQVKQKQTKAIAMGEMPELIIEVQEEIIKDPKKAEIMLEAINNPSKIDSIEGMTPAMKASIINLEKLKKKSDYGIGLKTYNNVKSKLMYEIRDDSGFTIGGKEFFNTTVSEKLKKNQIKSFESQGFIDIDFIGNDDIETDQRNRINSLDEDEKIGLINLFITYEKEGDISLHKDDLNWLKEQLPVGKAFYNK